MTKYEWSSSFCPSVHSFYDVSLRSAAEFHTSTIEKQLNQRTHRATDPPAMFETNLTFHLEDDSNLIVNTNTELFTNNHMPAASKLLVNHDLKIKGLKGILQ